MNIATNYSMKESVLKEIINYESKFNGGLQFHYEDKEEFKNDLIDTTKEGFAEILDYYKCYLNSCNNTNSDEEQRKELSDLILILEGVVYND